MDAARHIAIEEKPSVRATRRINASVILSTAALLCFVGGFLAPVLGLFIIIIIHTALRGDEVLELVGTWLMIVSIPLLLLGSHLMDLFERKR